MPTPENSLAAEEEKYGMWFTNTQVSSGEEGTCNAEKYYDTASGKYDSSKRSSDYYLCGSKDDGECRTMTWEDWNEKSWMNCKKSTGDNQDPCYNATEMTTPGVLTGDAGDGSPFSLGLFAEVGDMYDPSSDGKCANSSPASANCQIGPVPSGPEDKKKSSRPAYPSNNTFLSELHDDDK